MTKYIISVYDDTGDEYFEEKYFEREVHSKEEAIIIFKTKAEEIISNMASDGLFVSIWREFEWCEGAWTFKLTISGFKNNMLGMPVIARAVYMNY